MSILISQRIFPHVILIFAMILWSSSFIGFKVALSVYSPFEVVAGRMIVPSWMPMASILYLGFAVSLLGYGFYNFGLTRLPAGEVAAYINLIPIMTLGMGVLWLGEYLNQIQYLASALVIVGIIISQTAKRRNII